MRMLVCMCMLSGWLATNRLAAQEQTKTSAPPAAKQTRKLPAAIVIPKDAVETSPGLFRWTDKDGKAWMYRKTPFGVRRWQADAEDAPRSAPDASRSVPHKPAESGLRTTAVEQGDSIRFEEATPFGKRTWVRKKTELNDKEQSIWDLQRKKE
jgi:hypothetical protein